MRSQRFTTFSRSRGGGLLIFSSAAVLFVAAIASLAIGPTGISLDDIGVLFDGADDQSSRQARLVLFDLRLPRTIVGVFVGASLAVSGAMLQGLFRNPLADPSIIGVSGGAALAAVTTIALADGPLN
ncbi:MAG: iron chelate uptake ABC transporter family permease subunit, partial [Pseudomonadota bacterium]